MEELLSIKKFPSSQGGWILELFILSQVGAVTRRAFFAKLFSQLGKHQAGLLRSTGWYAAFMKPPLSSVTLGLIFKIHILTFSQVNCWVPYASFLLLIRKKNLDKKEDLNGTQWELLIDLFHLIQYELIFQVNCTMRNRKTV